MSNKKIKPKYKKGIYKGQDKVDHQNPDVTDIILQLKRRREMVKRHQKKMSHLPNPKLHNRLFAEEIARQDKISADFKSDKILKKKK
tara:strand:+ start:374 stop:634 length:261 start_codon:yes stop_codon:yes gene_type:complete